MINGKIAEFRVGQTHQPGIFFASEEQTSATYSGAVDEEIWSVPNSGISLYSISQRDQREDGHTGEFRSIYGQIATDTDQTNKEAIRIQRFVDQQSGPYCAGRIFSKEGACQRRRDKLRNHLTMIGCGSKSSHRYIISLFRQVGRLFSVNKILMN
ncbi:hypothetical protein SAMN05216311_1212 [Chitinophaga sp. CF418]|nr:hypothetical protein SAMN05216311_101939 [Chitinophaga sp. CF418]SHM69735.1 hypothetical protein SAMN05216311_1032 [Chitinophaga sp. CF418]SHN43623.1 hypothetical protein SAMN05216311_1161 [Chitinophaga sp. CF418]SHN45654.1 hypothetical protein SAMN05216311_1212 [Chitinophaga sp. CF418]